jgi:hypothetical protein
MVAAGLRGGARAEINASGAKRPRRAPEPFPFRLNRNGALFPCFDAFSSREPVSTPDQVQGRLSLENALILLRHKFIGTRRAIEARQHGHRGKRLTRASMMRRRTVAIEFGT